RQEDAMSFTFADGRPVPPRRPGNVDRKATRAALRKSFNKLRAPCSTFHQLHELSARRRLPTRRPAARRARLMSPMPPQYAPDLEASGRDGTGARDGGGGGLGGGGGAPTAPPPGGGACAARGAWG